MPNPPLKIFHFEIFKAKLHRSIYFWSRIKSSNHKILWASETYTTKQNAEIPVLKIIKYLGKKTCSLTFHDTVKGVSKSVKL